ncbi:MAG: Gfo/Idh/MocA family oxidoreductase [Clostridiales bacterium]|nr:Gfo/Idh/MocA family oxidoreductase [Clostridiales bacterium]
MSKIKIGVFGAWRGNSYISLFLNEPRIELIAICDKNISQLEELSDFEKDKLQAISKYTDFEDFLNKGKAAGMNAVFLANYFHEHAPYAIKCMEAGMDVISECTAASTLKQCVELVEAVEKTGKKYMLAENYPFSLPNFKLNQIVESGKLGTLLYAEGEYNHTGNNEELRRLTPGKYHWRAWMPRTYYVTHALGPLMFATKSMPKYVSARAAFSELLYQIKDWRHAYDGCAIMFCEMDNGMIDRFTGCTAMASDYSRYRVVGDLASVECGGNIGDNKVRLFYLNNTKPDNEEKETLFTADLNDFGEKAQKAKSAGHGGGDFWIVQIMIDYFADGIEPFFNVYRSVAMSATAIIGWRSCLNHGENMRIPDFTVQSERDAVRNDDLTPFPDDNGNGITLPCALPVPIK